MRRISPIVALTLARVDLLALGHSPFRETSEDAASRGSREAHKSGSLRTYSDKNEPDKAGVAVKLEDQEPQRAQTEADRTLRGQHHNNNAHVPTGPPPEILDRIAEKLYVRASVVTKLTLSQRGATPGDKIETRIALDGRDYDIVLEPHSARAPNYKVVIQEPGGALRSADPGEVDTYRGFVRNAASASKVDGSTVSASVKDGKVFARIIFPPEANGAGRQYWVEPIAGVIEGAELDDHIVYNKEEIMSTGRGCGLGHSHDEVASTEEGDAAVAGETPLHNRRRLAGCGGQGQPYCEAELAIDADYAYFQSYGSVGSVESRVNAIINDVNIQYERDVGITHRITQIIVRTSPIDDPYTATKADQLANQFRIHWNSNHNDIVRDVAQLFTGKELAGNTVGWAYYNGVCTAYGYGVVESDFSGNYARATGLSAHELGHNWDARHCPDTACQNTHTMDPIINDANVFHPVHTIPDMIAHRNTLQCISPVTSPSICGDNNVDPDEICDGTNLSGSDCTSFGCSGGSLACNSDCSGFVTSGCTGCPQCGNNITESINGEICDGTDLGGSDCTSFGCSGGSLACNIECSGFDTSGCTGCCVPTHTKEKGPRCSDGLDNDCDGLIDGDDPDC